MRSFVLRLLDDQLRDGRVVGRVVDVESGSEAVVRDVEELLTFLTTPDVSPPLAPAPPVPEEDGSP